MKILKWSILAVVVLVVVGLVILYVNLNRIVETTIEKQSTASLNLSTELDDVDLALFGGTLDLDGLKIGSPQGFSAPQMFALDGANVSVSYGQLRDDPVHIGNITLDGPTLVIEQKDMKLNLQALMSQESKAPEPVDEEAPPAEPLRLIVDQLTVTNASVQLYPNLPGLAETITVKISDISLQNVGTGEGNQNGAAIKEVVMEVATAMAAKAQESDQIPQELKLFLKPNLDEIAGQLGAEFNKQLDRLGTEIGKKIPGEVGGAVQDVIKDVQKGDDPGKSVQQGLQGLMNQEQQKKSEKDGAEKPKRKRDAEEEE